MRRYSSGRPGPLFVWACPRPAFGQNHLFALVDSAVDRNGLLSRTIRKRFADKVEPEAMDFIEEAAKEVLSRLSDDPQPPTG